MASSGPNDAPKHDKRPDRTGRGACGEVGQRVTLPAFKQPVQTLSRFGVPLTVARTRWMLGSNRRLVILRDQGRLLPKPGFLAQMSQTAATVVLLETWDERSGVWAHTGPDNRLRLAEVWVQARIRGSPD